MKRVLVSLAVAVSLSMVGCGLGTEPESASPSPQTQSQTQQLKVGTDGTLVCSDDKAIVCHKDPTGAQNSICVAASAVASHLAHGDYAGACVTDAGTL